jgi:hypothetical protein
LVCRILAPRRLWLREVVEHMTRYLRRIILLAAGLCWFAVALGIVVLLLDYVAGGAGLQVFGFFGVSSMSVTIGLLHVVGFLAGAFLCFAIGAGFWAHGVVPLPKVQERGLMQPKQLIVFLRHLVMRRRESERAVQGLRCVRCRAVLAAPVRICPECGWTQPPLRDLCAGLRRSNAKM